MQQQIAAIAAAIAAVEFETENAAAPQVGTQDPMQQMTSMIVDRPLAAQRLFAEMKADTEKDDKRCVGQLFPRPDNFRQPKGDLAAAIHEAATSHGMRAINMSPALLPRMTMAQVHKWKAKLFARIEEEPDTIFFVTVDNISATEAILAFDSQIKIAALSSGVDFQGHAQGVVWRGDDYVRLAGIRSDLSVVKQMMRTVLSPDTECVICLETMAEEIAAATAASKFSCAHMICARCGPSVDECPVCRNKTVVRR